MSLIDHFRTAWERWRVLRDFKAFDAQGKEDRYWAFRDAMIEAKTVWERDLTARAREIWQSASARYPEQALQSKLATELLLRLRLFDELEQLLQRGLKSRPADPRWLEGLAQSAFDQGNMELTLARCQQLRKKHPGVVQGHSLAAAALGRSGRADEAEAMFRTALRSFPSSAGLHIEYAKMAELRHDWTTARDRWLHLYDTCGHLSGIAGAATAMARLGEHGSADELIGSVRHKAGTEHLIWLASAQVAEIREDWDEAARRWASYRQRFPRLIFGYIQGTRPLLKLGREPEANAVLQAGVEQLPEEAEILIEYALLAHRRKDWPEAARRWEQVRTAFPAQARGYTFGAEAMEALGKTDAAAALRGGQAPARTAEPALPMAAQ